MVYLTVHADYQQVLTNAGLHTPADILHLDSVIFCGHPGRNVARASLIHPGGELQLLIKREHGVSYKERLANLADGFGFVSKSQREAMTLSSLRAGGIEVPQWIAHGRDRSGCAFLVLRECVGAMDLRTFLSRLQSVRDRADWIKRLGRELATIHESGFDHPDLYAKHVLVREDGAPCFIDWQRTKLRRHVNWRARLRGLARLNATIPDGCATFRERWRCLEAYLAFCRARETKVPEIRGLCRRLQAESVRISRWRRLREQIKGQPGQMGAQVGWRDGEALCITAEFEKCLGNDRPDWLVLGNLPSQPVRLQLEEKVTIAGLGDADLTRSRQLSCSHFLRRITGRERPSSPELRHAGMLFRLERLGLPAPRVLAFGQRFRSFGQMESFVLRSSVDNIRAPKSWLEENTRKSDERRQLVQQAGQLLRQLHRANFYLGADRVVPFDNIFAVCPSASGSLRVVLNRVNLLISRRHESLDRARQDLRRLRKSPAGRRLTRTDCLRFLLAYCEAESFGGAERAFWLRLSKRSAVKTLAMRLFGL